ncbi:MAG: hypothetical protein ACJATV_000570 [Granulosicoccus sp.]|jgi:hypothetical protein
MAKGFHFGRLRCRRYTSQLKQIKASVFRGMIGAELRQYQFDGGGYSKEHSTFELMESKQWGRVACFTIQGQKIPIPLLLDNSSISNKLYLLCPCCTSPRQSLYATKSAYACRTCLNLHYPSQSERKDERLARRVRKHRLKLWGYEQSEINNLTVSCRYFDKPYNMHWSTFLRHRDSIEELEGAYWHLQNERLIRWGYGQPLENTTY